VSSINALRDPSVAGAADARVLSLRRGPEVPVLLEADLERIRAATLDVLWEIGVAVTSERVAGRLSTLGADADAQSGRVRFPSAVVEDALRSARPVGLLAARDPACDLPLSDGDGWLGAGGSAGAVVDLGTDERRSATLADVADAARLADVDGRAALYQDADPGNDPPLLGAGAENCVTCHHGPAPGAQQAPRFKDPAGWPRHESSIRHGR